jgi:hypothetical protein
MRHYRSRLLSSGCLVLTALAALFLPSDGFCADDLAVEAVGLPALQIEGQAARAHTQGLEIIDGKYYVTARRDDLRPQRALLLRTALARADWDVWDITPVGDQGEITTLDHPGGMQSDGMRLWIPLAESKRGGRSVIRAFQLKELYVGRTLKSDFEFPVNDHIGALAVSAESKLILGASWDTQKIYLWDFTGRLLQTLVDTELKARGLGFVAGPEGRAGIAVQDWKRVGDRLFASGLFRSEREKTGEGSPKSRLIWFTGFSERHFKHGSVTLPMQNGTELGREAMAISDGMVYFLPEDLGASNRMFRVSVSDLTKRATVEKVR